MEHEGIAYKVFNTRLMFNMNHGGDKNAADGLNNNSSEFSILLDFHHHVNTVIAMVRPKDVMVYARGINHE